MGTRALGGIQSEAWHLIWGLGAYATKFDPASRLSLFGLMAHYTSTESIVATVIRPSMGSDAVCGICGFVCQSSTPLDRQAYPMAGAGLQFVLKPDKHLLASLEYAQGVQGNYGIYLKFGYAW